MSQTDSDIFADARADALRTAAWANRLAAESRRERNNARIVRHLLTGQIRVNSPDVA